jgi:hypothetical protein
MTVNAWHDFKGVGLWCEVRGCGLPRSDAAHQKPDPKNEMMVLHAYIANPACCDMPSDRHMAIEDRYVHAPGAHTIEEAFEEFHSANPHVFTELVKLARRAKERGFVQYGIGALYEVFRWERGPTASDDDGYKVNNNFRAIYARKIMAEHPDLAGFFRTRARANEEGEA